MRCGLRAILYLETNFLVSFATGRSPEAGALLTEPIGPLDLVIPSICFREALTVLNNEEKRYKRLNNSIDDLVREARRNIAFPGLLSRSLKLLEGAKIARE